MHIESRPDLPKKVQVFLYDKHSFSHLAENPDVWDVDSDSIEEAENFVIASGDVEKSTAEVHFNQKVDVRLATRRTWRMLFGSRGVSMPAPLAEVKDDEESDDDDHAIPGPNPGKKKRKASEGSAPSKAASSKKARSAMAATTGAQSRRRRRRRSAAIASAWRSWRHCYR